MISTPAQAVDHSTHYYILGFWNWHGHETHIEWWYSKEGTKDFIAQISTAVSAWDATPTVLGFTRVYNRDSSVLRIYSGNYGDNGLAGLAELCPFWTNNYLNEYYNLTNYQWTIVATHEIGHGNSLGHYNCNSEVMDSNCIDNTYYMPYIGDIAGVNARYP